MSSGRMDYEPSDPDCILCNGTIAGDLVTVTRGLTTLINASRERGDVEICAKLESRTRVKVHEDCRKDYTRPSTVKAACKASQSEPSLISPVKKKLRTSEEIFDYKTHCLVCGKLCSVEMERKLNYERRQVIRRVETFELKDTLLNKCSEVNDETAKIIARRVNGILCLVAHEARYHEKCMSKFLLKNPSSSSSVGRPENVTALERVVDYLKSNDDCQFTMAELLDVMGDDAYCEQYLKTKLALAFGQDILFSTLQGVGSVITLRNTGNKILMQNWYNERESDECRERMRIVQTAAEIIREDIRAKVYDVNNYPSPSTVQSVAEAQVPETLQCFLKEVITKDKKSDPENLHRKCITIAHTIIAATRPRSFVSSILTGVSVYLHRKFGSKLLIDLLSRLGLSSSYSEVRVYESSSLALLNRESDGSYLQYVFDNADFNVSTLDGLNTFHQMGGIECFTPNKKALTPSFPRVDRIRDTDEYVKRNKVECQHWDRFDTPSECKVADLKALKPDYCDGGKTMPSESTLFWMLLSTKEGVPSWSGFMSKLTERRTCYQTSRIQCLPFIKLPPSSYDAIFSVLKFVGEKLKSDVKQSCIFITFDQPLYAKAHDMLLRLVKEDSSVYSKLILRLGGFHLLMSFMGAIGHIMSGSGLQELWSVIYAPNVASQMMTGHPYSRTLRGHFLTQLALVKMIVGDNEELGVRITEFLMTTDGLAFDAQGLTEISWILLEELTHLCKRGKTAALWIQYFHAVNLMRNFIEAERSGNWDLHQRTVHNMLPFFHASGHFHYARSAHMYIQEMYLLHEKMSPEDYKDFTSKGFFTIRRSEKFWSGLWTDLTIEQTLMRMIKSRGGLIGRGFQEPIVDKFIMSIPSTYEICEKVEEFSGVYSHTSEQHVELRSSRIARDTVDVKKLITWLKAHPPFPPVEGIMCIGNGVTGNEEVNCFKAHEVGSAVLNGIIGQDFHTLKLKRSDRVNTLTSKSSSVQIHGERIPVNTNLLFQRIMCFVKDELELRECFSHELAPFPTSLFDQFGMRKTQKSSLYSLFSPYTGDVPTDEITRKCHVIDGGFLLHRVHWSDGFTYNDIFGAYLTYVKRHFRDPIVVFDGYTHTSESTKAAEQKRRYGKVESNEILFTDEMDVTVSREVFLANSKNKRRFIEKLAHRFVNDGIAVKQAEGDADVLIVLTALHTAQEKCDNTQVYVVGEDIDLLVLLIHHSSKFEKVEVKLLKPGKTTTKQPSSVYCSSSIRSEIPGIEDYILVLHAFSGCDSTSAFFGKGKGTVFKWLRKSTRARELAVRLQNEDLQQEDVVAIGHKLVLDLYNCKDEDMRLNNYRYTLFHKKVSKSKKAVQLESLPPTEDAAGFHLLRVYHQVAKWRNHVLHPLEWGWKGSPLVDAVQMLLPPAPSSVLALISCACKKECVRGCGCRKAGLKCTIICAHCEGRSCFNKEEEYFEEDVEIEIMMDDDF